MNKNKKFLGAFALAMINVAAIVSLRNLSFMVEYGVASIFFYVVAAICFFIPTALVCAELATGWPKANGIFGWVTEAFGPNVGFFAQWMNWMFSIASFPTVLTFLAATIAYLIDPVLAHDRLFIFSTILGIFWLLTFLNFLGMRTSTWVSTIGVVVGTIVPGLLIIILGITWLSLGQEIQLVFKWNLLLPKLEISNLVFLSAVVLGLAGMEMSAFYANETKNPQKVYPKAIFISMILILLLSVLGSLSMALVVPNISLVAGVMQAFQIFFDDFGMSWAVPLIALLAVLGSFAGNNTWIIGPAKGVHQSAIAGFMPPWMQKVNSQSQPVAILLIQAVIGSILTLVFFLMPSVNSAFWLVTAITAQFAMVMYILVFASAIRLKYTQPQVMRTYQVFGGKVGMWLVAGVGLFTSAVCFFLSFIPPAQLEFAELWIFEGYLLIGLALLSLPPFIFAKLRKAHWSKVSNGD